MSEVLDKINFSRNQGKIWKKLFFVSVLISIGVNWRLADSINSKPLIVTGGANAYTIVKAQDFKSAKAYHIEAAAMAVQTIFNRHPSGLDSPVRLQRFFQAKAYKGVENLLESEADEFNKKGIHQKVEITNIELLRAQDNSVNVSVKGQLIRNMDFSGRMLTEVLELKVQLLLVDNPGLLANGGFPILVADFDHEITTQKSK